MADATRVCAFHLRELDSSDEGVIFTRYGTARKKERGLACSACVQLILMNQWELQRSIRHVAGTRDDSPRWREE